MANVYNFIDNGDSFTVERDGTQYTAGKNFVELLIQDSATNRYLEIRSNSASFTSVKVDLQTDTINGVGSGSTTATELRDALEAIFFLDDSGIFDAPSDGQLYGRKDGAWDVVTAGLEFQDYTILETAWSGNTDYESTVTFAGAALGDTFAVGVSEGVEINLDNAGAVSYSNAYATGANTVKIRGRISSYINIPAGSIIRIIKLA